MKKNLITILLTTLLVTACHASKPAPHRYYAAYGYYYLDGTVITDDGNVWGFQTDALTANATRVKVVFDDNATPDNITDDIILLVTEQNN